MTNKEFAEQYVGRKVVINMKYRDHEIDNGVSKEDSRVGMVGVVHGFDTSRHKDYIWVKFPSVLNSPIPNSSNLFNVSELDLIKDEPLPLPG